MVVAETPRRGRFDTIAPEILASGAGTTLPAGDPVRPELALSARDLPDIADALRARQRIVQAVCVAG